MKKIAVLYSGDSRALNGAALYVNRFRKFCKEFREAGIYPIICDFNNISSNISDENNIVKRETAYANSKSHRMKNKIKSVLSNTYIGSCLYIYLAWQKPGKKSIKINALKIKEADLLLANDMYSAYYAIKEYPDKKLFFVMHNSGILLKMMLDRLSKVKGTKKEKSLHKVETSIFEHAKGILFVSRKARDTFVSMFHQFNNKAFYVPEGIEDIDRKPNLDFLNVNLVCVGTVCDRKNQFTLVKAFENFKESEIKLSIVGNGTMLEKCKEYAISHSISNIEFTGSVKNSDIPNILSKSNVFILASKDEGLPAVGIEALRSGLPILITDVGGCAELVQNNGKILSGTAEKNIKDGIEYIIQHKNELAEMSKKSRELYEQEFSVKAMVSVYKQLLVDEKYGE